MMRWRNTTWKPAPSRPTIRDELHLWRVELEIHPHQIEPLERTLSSTEHERAQRFRFPQHRRRFVVRRGVLRDVLGRYLSVAPERIEFEKNRYGKLSVIGQETPNEIRFNLSHSADLATIALTRGREVGVDIEQIKPERATSQIARRFFASSETKAITALPSDEQTVAFFRCWTRKEAYIKAKGQGLSLPLSSFEVTVAANQPPALQQVSGDSDEILRWTMGTFDPGPSFLGAFVVEVPCDEQQCWQWRPL